MPLAGQRARARVLDVRMRPRHDPVRRRWIVGTVALGSGVGARGSRAASEDSLQLLLPFPAIGSPEYVGRVPATRLQRGLQTAAPAGPAEALARVLARAAEVATGRPVRVVRFPGGRGERALRAAATDPTVALLASEALCVHEARASGRLRQAVDRLEVCLPVAQVAYRRVGSPEGSGAPACTLAHAGHGGRSAALAEAWVAVRPGCREVAFNGGRAALEGVSRGQADGAVLPLGLVRPAIDAGQVRDLGPVEPPGWFALLAIAGGRWSGAAATLEAVFARLAPDPLFESLGLLRSRGGAEALRHTMLRERETGLLSSEGTRTGHAVRSALKSM